MIDFSLIEDSTQLIELTDSFINNNIDSLAMDFEEESNLHAYGEHLCIIQLFDRKNYYIIDALKIQKEKDGINALKYFLESNIEKIMFDCSSDSAIVRKTLSIQLNKIFDIRIIAQALEFTGNLTSLIERNLNIKAEDPNLKKKYQRANWMKRPLGDEQLSYALSDVQYLFDLKESLINEMKGLPVQTQRHIEVLMRSCAHAKHKEKPGWEKICNYKTLNKKQKVFIRNFFMARDALAKKVDVPPTNILEKQYLVQMAKAETWENILPQAKLKYSEVFEQARLKSIEELKASSYKA